MKINDVLLEFAPAGSGGGNTPRGPRTPGRDPWGDNDSGEDPYSRPEPEYYSRSIDYFGRFEADHFDDEEFDKATGVFKGYWDDEEGRVQIGYFKFDDPAATGSDDPGMGWYYEPQNESVAEDAEPMDREWALVKKLGRLGERVVQNPKLWDRYDQAIDNDDTDWIIGLIQDGTGATASEVSKLADLFGEIGGGLGRIIDFAWAVKQGTWNEDFMNPYRAHRSQDLAEDPDDSDDYYSLPQPYGDREEEFPMAQDTGFDVDDEAEDQHGLSEFAPPSSGDDGEPDEEILRKLAAQWWSGTEQQMNKAQRTLELMGWEIGPDESGDDDAGVYVYRIGDNDGRDTMAFGHSDLSLDEAKKKKKKKSSRSLRGYFFPGYAYYGSGDSGEGGGDGGGGESINRGEDQINEILPALAAGAGALARGAAAAGRMAAPALRKVPGAVKTVGQAVSRVPGAVEKVAIQGLELLNDKVPGGIFNPDGSLKGSQYLTKYLSPQEIQQAQQHQKQGVAEAPGAETLAHNQSTVASNEKAFDLGEGKPKEKEADYGADYQDMVARVKKLAGLGPLKTVYDPAKRVYKNVPVAVQPKK